LKRKGLGKKILEVREVHGGIWRVPIIIHDEGRQQSQYDDDEVG
jgi:hypothetical protein